MPDQVMSKSAQLIDAIAKHAGPIRSDELERITGIGRKNHSGLLATAVSKGLVIRAEVMNENRACSEYRVGTAYTPGAVKRMENAPPIEHIEPSPRSLLREMENAPPFTPPAAAVEYTAASAKTVQELANALDTITEQKRTIANLRIECNNLEARLKDHQPGDPRLMIAALQARMTGGIELAISADTVALIDSDSREFKIEPHEFFKFMDALAMLEERLAA